MAEVSTSRQRCAATRIDGSPCGGYAVSKSVFCFAHDPLNAGAIAEARRRGGQARHGRRIGVTGDAEAVALATLGDVLTLLERAVNDVLTLENSISRARALGYLAGAWGTLYESSELERRVAALEAAQHGST
jgi:hypothetical protein